MSFTVFFNLLEVIGILTLLLATGFICRCVGLIDDIGSKRLSALIIKLGQPMMIVGALINKEFSWGNLKTGLIFMLIGFLIHPLMVLLAYLTGFLYKDENQRKITIFALTFTNCGFIGFPILDAIFPGQGSFIGAFFVIGFHIYVWTLGIYILGKGREDIKLTPKKALLNPGTIPCVIGFGLYLLKAVIPLPQFTVDFTMTLYNLCLPISVLVTGALIAKEGLLRMAQNPRLYIFNLIKLLGMPLIVSLVAKLVTLGMADSYSIVLFCTVIAALPSGATISMLGEMYDISPEYAAQCVGSSSILSIGTLPLLYFVGDFIARL
ncbi:MAG: AEC family transporter [Clostridia bacterium]|nr:AEC family transporter [Clostridia bacterium]